MRNQPFRQDASGFGGEKSAYTCRELELEMAKAASFVNDIVAQSQGVSGKDVLGFLGDFGIGNEIEFKEATTSGMQRLASLRELFAQRQCQWTITPVSTPIIPNAKQESSKRDSGPHS